MYRAYPNTNAHLIEHFDDEGTHYEILGGTGAPSHQPRETPVPEEERDYRAGRAFCHAFLIDIQEGGAKLQILDVKTGKVMEAYGVGRDKMNDAVASDSDRSKAMVARYNDGEARPFGLLVRIIFHSLVPNPPQAPSTVLRSA